MLLSIIYLNYWTKETHIWLLWHLNIGTSHSQLCQSVQVINCEQIIHAIKNKIHASKILHGCRSPKVDNVRNNVNLAKNIKYSSTVPGQCTITVQRIYSGFKVIEAGLFFTESSGYFSGNFMVVSSEFFSFRTMFTDSWLVCFLFCLGLFYYLEHAAEFTCLPLWNVKGLFYKQTIQIYF